MLKPPHPPEFELGGQTLSTFLKPELCSTLKIYLQRHHADRLVYMKQSPSTIDEDHGKKLRRGRFAVGGKAHVMGATEPNP